MIIEDFDPDEEIALLEAAGAGPEKYLMHANAHSMAAQKYMAACKSTAGAVTPERKKLMRALGKKHKAAADALSAIANHHVDATFAATDKKRQALRNPAMAVNEDTDDHHRALTNHGWKHTDYHGDGEAYYEHKDHPKDAVTVSGTGSWTHWRGGHDQAGGSEASGLRHHLRRFHDNSDSYLKEDVLDEATHRVHIKYDDPSGTGIASMHVLVNAKSKEHAKSRAMNQIGSWPHPISGYKNARVHRVEELKKKVNEEMIDEGYEMENGDLIRLAILEKPLEFREMVYEMLVDRAHDALEDLRVSVYEALVADADDSDGDSEDDEGEGSPEIEESEQIDELSKGTLGRYIKASASDRQERAVHGKELENADDNLYKSALSLGAKVGGETRSKAYDMRDSLKKDINDNRRKQSDRSLGIHRALKRLTKEGVDEAQDGAYFSAAGAAASRNPTKGTMPMEREPEPGGKRFPTGRQEGDVAMKKLGQRNKSVKSKSVKSKSVSPGDKFREQDAAD